MHHVNDSIIRGLHKLNKLYAIYSKHFQTAIKKYESDVDSIDESEITTVDEILMYACSAVTALNTVILLTICFCFRR